MRIEWRTATGIRAGNLMSPPMVFAIEHTQYAFDNEPGDRVSGSTFCFASSTVFALPALT